VSFISRGMKPVEETFRRLTPLHLAAAANWPEAVALLLAGGADKYAQDSELCLPIDFAMHTKCLEAVELLLEGDCIPNFIRPRKHGITTIPLAMLIEIHSGKGSVQNALVRTLIRLRHFLGALRPYHDLALLAWDKEPGVAAADRLFSAGFRDLELRDEHGMTPLMKACLYATLQFLRFLLEKGANASTPHRDSALTAGYFLAGSMDFDSSFSAADSELCAKLLQAAFNVADTVDSNCLCSPEGFTPVTALSRSKNGDKRRKFGTLMLCLQGLKGAVEQQARAFALGEIFDRLQMTHTCVNIHQPSQQIPEEDRLEIESEEEEFSMQLRELMKEYDLGRVEFSGGPLEFLDFFFEMQELNLPSQDYPWIWSHKYNSNDKDLLGPGVQYQSCRASFAGKQIFYGHREEVNEENMLALLFDEDYTWV
jgi:hypothetical protein